MNDLVCSTKRCRDGETGKHSGLKIQRVVTPLGVQLPLPAPIKFLLCKKKREPDKMDIGSDYKDLLRILNKHKVKYLIVGAYAVIYYVEPRYTKDIDIWVEPGEKNAKRVYEALKEFGAPLKGITIKNFTDKNSIYQIGIEPVRADIIMGLSNIGFNSAWKQKVVADFGEVKVNIIGRNELIRTKRMTGRTADKLDVESLSFKPQKKRK